MKEEDLLEESEINFADLDSDEEDINDTLKSVTIKSQDGKIDEVKELEKKVAQLTDDEAKKFLKRGSMFPKNKKNTTNIKENKVDPIDVRVSQLINK